jgi:hypothetical protein
MIIVKLICFVFILSPGDGREKIKPQMTGFDMYDPLPLPSGAMDYTICRYTEINNWLINHNIETIALLSEKTEESLRSIRMPLGYRLSLKAWKFVTSEGESKEKTKKEPRGERMLDKS